MSVQVAGSMQLVFKEIPFAPRWQSGNLLIGICQDWAIEKYGIKEDDDAVILFTLKESLEL